jgi:hypothetical protein
VKPSGMILSAQRRSLQISGLYSKIKKRPGEARSMSEGKK